MRTAAALALAGLLTGASAPSVDVYMIGDSTMADKAEQDINPEVGWGQVFPRYFTADVRVHNHAVNGRSTKSFIDEGKWAAVEHELKKGDYVFIEFGHNDEKKGDSTRYADPHGAYRANLDRFIRETRARGATPILLTPIVRRAFDAHGALRQTHGDYPEVVRGLAKADNVAFIDLEAETRRLVQAAGPDSSKRLYDYVGPGESLMFPKGREDDTHLSMRGAIAVAGLVAKSLAHSTPALSKFVRATPAPVDTPEARLLWNGAAPGAVGDSTLDRPTITAYLPHSAVPTAAMVVFPGGGYDHLSTDKEGAQVARWLNSLGVAAFMVRYRVGPRYHQPAMIDDGLQAMRVVRENAAKWHIDPHRVGVIGFSAGGHLAGIVGTRSDASTRPDLMMLVYPVVTMDERWAHRGSRAMLLGASPSADLVRSFSVETQVTSSTPPAFIVASTDDASVPVQNSEMLYDALRTAKVPVEMHVFESAKHGFGLAQNDSSVSQWTLLAERWLARRGWTLR
jgi:acetyl esterase/lipase